MKQVGRLIIKIQAIRSKLEKLSACKGYTHSEVVTLSQQLDDLLNQYWRVVTNE